MSRVFHQVVEHSLHARHQALLDPVLGLLLGLGAPTEHRAHPEAEEALLSPLEAAAYPVHRDQQAIGRMAAVLLQPEKLGLELAWL